MNSKATFLINLFCVMVMPSLMAQDIPDSRRYEWNRAGLSDKKFESQQTINLIQFGADPSGKESSDEAFLDAMMELGDQPGTIYFPAGRYLFHKSLILRDSVILKGDGNQTTLVFDLFGENHCIVIAGSIKSLPSRLAETALKDSQTLVFQPALPLQKGDLFSVTAEGLDRITSNWAKYSVGQIFTVDQVHAEGRIDVDARIRMNFYPTENLQINRIHPISQVGLECLHVERSDETNEQTSTIFIENATDVWINNIESIKGNFAHVEIKRSSHVEVSASYFHDAHHFGNGGKGYGVVMHFTTGETKIENNIFDKLRHSILLQAGANGNVVGYNYSVNPHWTDVALPANSAGDIVLHGNYPYANLFEGNVVQNVVIDDSHGQNGPHNTIYRNEIQLYGLLMNASPPSDSQTIVGNTVNNTSFIKGLFVTSGVGHFLNGNYVKKVLTPSNSLDLTEQSLYQNDLTFKSNGNEGTSEPLAAVQRYSDKKYTQCAGAIVTGTIEHAEPGVELYPNPTEGRLVVSGGTGRLEIRSTSGQLTWQQTLESQAIIDVQNWAPGIYLLSVYSNDSKISHREFIVK